MFLKYKEKIGKIEKGVKNEKLDIWRYRKLCDCAKSIAIS